MNAKTKSNSVVTHEYDALNNSITFKVRDAGQFEMFISSMHADVIQRATLHGLIQRISDKAAMERNPETGQPASPVDKMARMKALADHYASGSPDWSTRVAADGVTSSGITYEAIAKVKGCTIPEAQTMVAARAAKTGAEVKTVLANLRGNAEVIRAMAEIKAGRAPKIDTSLEDLG